MRLSAAPPRPPPPPPPPRPPPPARRTAAPARPTSFCSASTDDLRSAGRSPSLATAFDSSVNRVLSGPMPVETLGRAALEVVQLHRHVEHLLALDLGEHHFGIGHRRATASCRRSCRRPRARPCRCRAARTDRGCRRRHRRIRRRRRRPRRHRTRRRMDSACAAGGAAAATLPRVHLPAPRRAPRRRRHGLDAKIPACRLDPRLGAVREHRARNLTDFAAGGVVDLQLRRSRPGRLICQLITAACGGFSPKNV